MSLVRDTPFHLRVASGALVTGALVQLIRAPNAIGAIAALIAIVFAWLLLRGSRAGWLGTLILCAAQVVGSVLLTEITIALVIGLVVSSCLLVPATFRFIWGDRDPRRSTGSLWQNTFEKVGGLGYNLMAFAAGWEQADQMLTKQRREYGLLAWRLGILAVLFLIPLTASYNWDQASHRHDALKRVIADVVWTCWALIFIAFVAALVMTAYEHTRSGSRVHDAPESRDSPNP